MEIPDAWSFDMGTPAEPQVALSLPTEDGAVPAWGQESAQRINQAVEETCGLRAPVLTEGSAARCTIALGNMANNSVIRREYERFRTLVDSWYPGAGGWVLQPVHSARGGGKTIVVGGSDGAGVLEAAHALAAQILHEGPRISWRLCGRLGPHHHPLPEDRIDVLGTASSQIRTPWSELPAGPYASGYSGGSPETHLLRLGMYGPHADNSHFSRSSELGLRYLYTTEPEDGRAYRTALLQEIDLGVVRGLYHYKSLRMFQLWEILSPSPVFTDADREMVTRALLEYLTSGTGIASLDRIVELTTDEGIFDRHTACEALNLLVGAGYFHRLTGDPVWIKHRQTADRYFRAQAGTDVPYTGLTEGYATYLEVYLDWLLEAHPEEASTDPHIRIWADRILGLCTNRGIMIEGVQSDPARFPYVLLRKLAVLLDDGRYRFAADSRHAVVPRGRDRVMQFSAGQAWETGIEPMCPHPASSLTVFGANARLHRARAPGLAVERCFDRVVGRGSWEPDGEYWCIAGMTGIGKILPNVAALACYERFGTSYLISPQDGLRAEENSPWACSRAAILHPGGGNELIHGAEITGRWETAGMQIIRFRMESGHTHWERTVCWKPEAFMLVGDRLRLSGSTSGLAAVCWRLAQPPEVEEGHAWFSRPTPQGGQSWFHLAVIGAAEMDVEPRADGSILVASAALTTQEARFATLFHATTDGPDPVWTVTPASDDIEISGPEAYRVTELCDGNPPRVIRRQAPAPQPSAPPPHPTPARAPSAELQAATVLDSPIAACATRGDQVVLATHNGWIHSARPGQAMQTLAQVPGDVTALALHETGILAGTTQGTIHHLDPEGREAWVHRVQFLPQRTFWWWWFRDTPAIGCIAAARDPVDGRQYVVAGTGSDSVVVLDGDTGQVVSHEICPHGWPDRIWGCVEPDTGGDRAVFYVAHSSHTCTSAAYRYVPSTGPTPVSYGDAMPGEIRSPGWDMAGVVGFHVSPRGTSPSTVTVLRHGTYTQLSAYDRESRELRWCREIGGRPVALVDTSAVVPGSALAVCHRSGWVVAVDACGEVVAEARVARGLDRAWAASGVFVGYHGTDCFIVGDDLSVTRLALEGRPICAVAGAVADAPRVWLLVQRDRRVGWCTLFGG